MKKLINGVVNDMSVHEQKTFEKDIEDINNIDSAKITSIDRNLITDEVKESLKESLKNDPNLKPIVDILIGD